MNKEVTEKVKRVKNRVGSEVKKVKVLEEFRQFIARGNVLDLAVGVIIGASFQSLVTSLTDNIISPILGCFSEVDFNAYSLKIGNLNLKYGAFLTDVINFIIMAFIVFLIVKFMNKILTKKEKVEEKPAPVPEDIKLLQEIRDLLQKQTEE